MQPPRQRALSNMRRTTPNPPPPRLPPPPVASILFFTASLVLGLAPLAALLGERAAGGLQAACLAGTYCLSGLPQAVSSVALAAGGGLDTHVLMSLAVLATLYLGMVQEVGAGWGDARVVRVFLGLLGFIGQGGGVNRGGESTYPRSLVGPGTVGRRGCVSRS